MKKVFLLASCLSISSLMSSPTIAAGFSTIYGFGDSLSDTGNLNQVVFELTGGTQTFPPSPPYFMGRFSNGPAWIETFAQSLDIPLLNFAFGGATTGPDNTLDNLLSGFPLVGLEQQIGSFAMDNPVADPNALYTIWAGANDYLPNDSLTFTAYDNPDQTLTNIEMAINSLLGIGANNIMVFNLPNLGDIPGNNQSVDGICPDDNQFDGDCLNELTLAHNDGLVSLISSFPSDKNLILIDINTLVDNTIQNPSPLFTNVTDACLNLSTFEVCDNPHEFLFWDNRHPTESGNELISELAVESLGIPEPKTIFGLLTIGLMGIGTKIKKIR